LNPSGEQLNGASPDREAGTYSGEPKKSFRESAGIVRKRGHHPGLLAHDLFRTPFAQDVDGQPDFAAAAPAGGPEQFVVRNDGRQA
jgi:hypothetical protein